MVEKIFENSNVMKVLAFMLALLLWFFVNSDGRNQVVQTSHTFSNIPVTWQNLHDDLVITRRPGNVDVVIRGDTGVLDEITPQDLVIYVDLQGRQAGVHTVQVTGTSPRGTRITSINPGQVELELDEIISQQMEVEVEITGVPEEGFITGTPEINPHQVFVQGPRQQVQEVARIFGVVDVDGLSEDVQATASLIVHNFNNRPVTGVSVRPDTVDIVVPIHMPDKEVGVHVPLEGEPEEGFKVGDLSVSPLKIRIFGFLSVLEDILRLETKSVDISGASEDVTLEVDLVLPEGVHTEAETVSVTIPIIPDD